MGLRWKVAEFLDARSISAYQLMKQSGLAQGTAYRIARNKASGVSLKTLEATITALRELSGESVQVEDMLTYDD